MVRIFSSKIKIPSVYIVLLISVLLNIILFIKYANSYRDEKLSHVKGLSDRSSDDMQIVESKQLSNGKYVAVLRHIMFDGMGLAILDDNHNVSEWLPECEYFGPNEGDRYPGDHLDWWTLDDINNDGFQELAVQYTMIGSAGSHPFYLYQYKNDSFNLLFKFIEGRSNVELKDLDNNDYKEIIFTFSLSSTGWYERTYTPWKEVWTWQNGKYQLANNLFPDIYQEMLPKYDELMKDSQENELAQPYLPVIKCLEEKAKLNISGILADGKDCRNLIP